MPGPNFLKGATLSHRLEAGRILPARHARTPAENFLTAVVRAGRTPPRVALGRYADRAGARTIRGLLFFSREDASTCPARKSTEEKRLPVPATYPRRILVADSATPSRLPSGLARSLPPCCGRAHPTPTRNRRAALSAGSRPKHP